MRQNRGLRLEGEWNKTGKSPRLVLQPAQLTQMIHPMREGLDVAVKHRAGAPPTQFVPGAMNVQPFGSGFFAPTNGIAHHGIENFRTAARNRTETVPAQKPKHFTNREAKDALSKVAHFDSGESLDM